MQLFKKFHRSENTALIILIEEMEDLMKIVISLQESELLIKGIRETVKKEVKEQNHDFSKCY